MSEDRIIELEMKSSHQEIAIEELHRTVFDQHVRITALEKSLKTLTERFEGTSGAKPEIGPGNEKPPHY